MLRGTLLHSPWHLVPTVQKQGLCAERLHTNLVQDTEERLDHRVADIVFGAFAAHKLAVHRLAARKPAHKPVVHRPLAHRLADHRPVAHRLADHRLVAQRLVAQRLVADHMLADQMVEQLAGYTPPPCPDPKADHGRVVADHSSAEKAGPGNQGKIPGIRNEV